MVGLHDASYTVEHFPLSLPLEEPLDGGLRRARLTLQEGTAALHPKLHCFSQTFLHFGIKASALPQWITMFNVLSSAPPLGGRSEGRAALSIPGAVGVPGQTAVRAGPAIHTTAVQRYLGQPRV